ncbi:MAG: hypothetical protein ACXWVU_04285, partial [Sulfuricurvum sp.]
ADTSYNSVSSKAIKAKQLAFKYAFHLCNPLKLRKTRFSSVQRYLRSFLEKVCKISYYFSKK